MGNKQKIVDVLSQTSLTLDEQADLAGILHTVDEEDLGAIVELLESDTALIPRLYQNLKAKREAIQKCNANLWHGVVREEEEMLESLGE